MNGKRQKIQPGLALQPRDWGEPSVGGSQGVEPSMAKSTLESPAPTDRMSPSTLNPVEPPWYGPVCPVVWEGRHREVPPYPDALSILAANVLRVGFLIRARERARLKFLQRKAA